MKKKVTKEIEVEVKFCNICGEEINKEPWNQKRIEIVRMLFKTDDFHVHEICINKVIKAAFEPFLQTKQD